MDFSAAKEEGINVIKVKNRIDTSNYQDFDDYLSGIIERGEINLILDCSQLEYISSSGLRVFVKTLKTLDELNGRFAICGFNHSVQDIFKVTGLIKLFNIFASKSDALESFR